MQEETEQVLRNEAVRIEPGIAMKSGEPRYLELGHTDARRIIYIIWTTRGTKTRVVTADRPGDVCVQTTPPSD